MNDKNNDEINNNNSNNIKENDENNIQNENDTNINNENIKINKNNELYQKAKDSAKKYCSSFEDIPYITNEEIKNLLNLEIPNDKKSWKAFENENNNNNNKDEENDKNDNNNNDNDNDVASDNNNKEEDEKENNNEQIYLVDCRTNEEQSISMIPNAISQQTFEYLLKHDSLAANPRIITYCTVGYRSGVYARELKEKGFDNVQNSEGIILWTHECGNLVKNIPAKSLRNTYHWTTDVHTYGKAWAFSADGYKQYQFNKWDSMKKGFSVVKNAVRRLSTSIFKKSSKNNENNENKEEKNNENNENKEEKNNENNENNENKI